MPYWYRFYDMCDMMLIYVYMLHDTLDTVALATASYVLASVGQKIMASTLASSFCGLINNPEYQQSTANVTKYWWMIPPSSCTSCYVSLGGRMKVKFGAMLQVGEAVQLYIQWCGTVEETASHVVVEACVSPGRVRPWVLVDESLSGICM